MPFTSVADEMHRYKKGDLHSGRGGPVVRSRRQAIAIALSEERRAKGDSETTSDQAEALSQPRKKKRR